MTLTLLTAWWSPRWSVRWICTRARRVDVSYSVSSSDCLKRYDYTLLMTRMVFAWQFTLRLRCGEAVTAWHCNEVYLINPHPSRSKIYTKRYPVRNFSQDPSKTFLSYPANHQRINRRRRRFHLALTNATSSRTA